MNSSKVTQKLHWDEILLAALREDIPWEDVSANAVVPAASRGHADLIAKADGVIAGLPVFWMRERKLFFMSKRAPVCRRARS